MSSSPSAELTPEQMKLLRKKRITRSFQHSFIELLWERWLPEDSCEEESLEILIGHELAERNALPAADLPVLEKYGLVQRFHGFYVEVANSLPGWHWKVQDIWSVAGHRWQAIRFPAGETFTYIRQAVSVKDGSGRCYLPVSLTTEEDYSIRPEAATPHRVAGTESNLLALVKLRMEAGGVRENALKEAKLLLREKSTMGTLLDAWPDALPLILAVVSPGAYTKAPASKPVTTKTLMNAKWVT
jgi:hypothetical protein